MQTPPSEQSYSFFFFRPRRGAAERIDSSRGMRRARISALLLIVAAAGPWNGFSDAILPVNVHAAAQPHHRLVSEDKGYLRSSHQAARDRDPPQHGQLPGNLKLEALTATASPTQSAEAVSFDGRSLSAQHWHAHRSGATSSIGVTGSSAASRRLLPPFKPWGLKSKKEPPLSPPTVQLPVPPAPLGGVYLGPRAGIVNDLYREVSPRPATSYLIEESRQPPPTATELIDIGNQHRKYLLTNPSEILPPAPREPLLNSEVLGPPSTFAGGHDTVFFHEATPVHNAHPEPAEREEPTPLTPLLPGSRVPSLLEGGASPVATPGATSLLETGPTGSGGGATTGAERIPYGHGPLGYIEHGHTRSSPPPTEAAAHLVPADHRGSFSAQWPADHTARSFENPSPHTVASGEGDGFKAPTPSHVGYYSSTRHPSGPAGPQSHAAAASQHVAQLVGGSVTESHQHRDNLVGLPHGHEKPVPAVWVTAPDEKRFHVLMGEALYLVCLQQAQNGYLSDSQHQQLIECVSEMESYDGPSKGASVSFFHGQNSAYLTKFCHLPYAASEKTVQTGQGTPSVPRVSEPPSSVSSVPPPESNTERGEIDAQLLQNVLESLLAELQKESEGLESQLQNEEHLDAAEREEVKQEMSLLAQDIDLVAGSLERLKAGTLSQEELKNLWALLAQDETAPDQDGSAGSPADPANLGNATAAAKAGASGASARSSDPPPPVIVRNPYYSEAGVRERKGFVHPNSAHTLSGSNFPAHSGLEHEIPLNSAPAFDAHHHVSGGVFPDHAGLRHHPAAASTSHHQHYHSSLDSHAHTGARHALMAAILEGAIEIKIRILKSMHELNHLLESTNMPPERQDEARELLKYLSRDLEKLHQIVAHVEADELSMDDLLYISVELEAIRRQTNGDEAQEFGQRGNGDPSGGSGVEMPPSGATDSAASSPQMASVPPGNLEATGSGSAGAGRSSAGRDTPPHARTNVYITINIDDKGDVSADAGGGSWRP